MQHVSGSEKRTIALDEVKPPAIIAHVVSKPLHPSRDVFANTLLAMIKVGSGDIVLLGLVAACASKGGVVVADVGLVPGQPPSKLVPLTIFLQQDTACQDSWVVISNGTRKLATLG